MTAAAYRVRVVMLKPVPYVCHDLRGTRFSMCPERKTTRNIQLNRLRGKKPVVIFLLRVPIRVYDRFRELGKPNSRAALCGWSGPGRVGGWSAGKWTSEI